MGAGLNFCESHSLADGFRSAGGSVSASRGCRIPPLLHIALTCVLWAILDFRNASGIDQKKINRKWGVRSCNDHEVAVVNAD